MSAEQRPGRTLAVLLSIAARIEPELMRAVRLRVAPGLDVAAEVDLWFGDLVTHRGFGYVELNPALLEELRAELTDRLARAGEADPIHRLWPTFQGLRVGASPAMVAQETATWQAVSGRPDADVRIEEALRPALRALVEEEREAIARWFTEVWETLPERVRRSTTAWQLLTLSAVRLALDPPEPPQPLRLALADVAVIAEGLPKTRLHLGWDGPRLMLSDSPLDPGQFAVTVPDTDPRVVELVTASSTRTILIGRDTAVEEWVGPAGGLLHTADGATYTLPTPLIRRPDPVPEAPPEEQAPQRAGAGHISICYAGESRPWALWTAHQLDRAGCTTTLLHWDTATRTPTESLSALLAAPGRVLLLINERALRPDLRDESAWTEAFRLIVRPHRERFAAIALSYEPLPEAMDILRPVDVAGLDEAEARGRILRRLGIESGAEPPHPDGPRFPNDPQQAREAPRRNGYFTGRKDDLEELSELLGQPGARVVLHGISGVGKSHLATEYAHRYGDGYDVVWWITAGQRGTAREELAALAVHLNLAVARDVGERIRAVHAELRTRGGPRRRWLLIFDGADDMGEIRDLLPEGPGDVLITSLSRDWAAMLGFQEYTVRPFTRNESTAFIRRRVPRSTDEQAARLAETAQDLPLVLAQTTAWLIADPTVSVDAYLEDLEGQSPEELAVRTEDDYPVGFVRSWGLTLNSLRERDPEAAELIELMVLFSPDAIPVRLIETAPASVFSGRLARVLADSTRWRNALASLADLTAIHLTYSQDPSLEYDVESAQMHRMYHRYVRGGLTRGRWAELSRAANAVLAAANPGRPADRRGWNAYTTLIPHLDFAGTFDRDEPGVRKLVLDCVDTLRLRGEYDSGLRLCQLAVARWRSRYQDADADMLVLVHQHANLLRRVGRYRDAEAVGRAAVAELSGSRAPDDPELLRTKDGLGGTLMALGQFQRSRELFEEVWRGHSGRSGPEEPRALRARSNMALTLGLLGRYDESLYIHRELFELRARDLGADHYETLYSGLCLAWMTRLLGRYRRALTAQENNARLHSRVLGPLHPQTLRAEHNLAQCLRRDGRLDEATALFTSVLTRSHQVQGELHPDTLMMASDQATLLRMSSPRAAHDLADTLYDRYLRLLGPDHPYTAGSLANLSLAQWADGDERGESEVSAHNAWQLMTRAVGDDHPWTLGCRLNLAARLAQNEQAPISLAHDTELHAAAARKLGTDHPLTLAAATARACDLRTLGRSEEAEELRHDTVTRLRETLGPQHPHTRSAEVLRRPHWDFEPQPI
ncbi:FxSxx-COOH system tetratricopeptide repeat protein [Streptomyces sp. NBC_00566]|uniref:FxSxx-COOH system tetratricopeptide repeat protein n=1 Tax=Streptomyces sp. NBC_00566 TaxID=2975778 RepID=UPI002E80D7AE|nr:FxSxx-COOH system tetratricopeptide repeat protein [Streptomyces sp. NBC_00566]WUB85730.1 FxSxx-COOH system tetratricopeptide repeat protein [Streptomyces sp. NBC_00566]